MNPTRFEIVLKSQSSIARKVFAAVPTTESWSSAKIYAELQRLGSSTRNLRVVEGCLNTLMRVGLIVEGPRGHFMQPTLRSATKPTVEASVDASAPFMPAMPSIETPVEEVTPLEVVTSQDEQPAPADNLVSDTPYHFEPNTEVYEADPDYELYLNYRVERIEAMLIKLSEKLDSDTGLALLEIAEDLGDYHFQLLEYRMNLECPPTRMVVVNPGWYQHEVNGYPVFTRSPVLSEEEITKELERQRATQESLKEFQREFPHGSLSIHQEEQELRNELFARFEPNGEGNRPYYDSLMDRLKSYVPDLESVADTDDIKIDRPTENLVNERKTRRGMCDIKIKGISQAPEYRAWMNIVAPGHVQALQDEGLEVEEEWLRSFKVFLSDIGYRPEFGARLFRIDRDLGWVRNNVEWRKEGRVIPARRRAPTNWPLMQATDKVERGLKAIIQNAREQASRLIP